MFKSKTIIGTAGTLLFFAALVGLVYALNAPSQVSYESTRYSYPVFRAASPPPEWVVWVQYLPIPILALFWLAIWVIKSGQPFRVLFQQVGKWIWSHAYLLVAILTGVYLLLALIVWLQSDNSSTSSQTVQYGAPAAPSQSSDYIAIAEVTGPNELRFGTSSEVTLKMGITQGLSPSPCASLLPTQIYSATASLQTINFDIDDSAVGFQSQQTEPNPFSLVELGIESEGKEIRNTVHSD